MNERPFTRNLFFTLFSESCTELEKVDLAKLSTSVALEFVSKMKEIDQHEYAYLGAFSNFNFTRDETKFQDSIVNLSLKETCLTSNERTIQFLSNPKNLALGRSYYFWVFSDVPQNRIFEVLKPLSRHKAQFLILRCNFTFEHKSFHGVHFFQTPGFNLEEKTETVVKTIGESFYVPYPVLVRVGQLEQFTFMSIAPHYSYDIDVLDIVGFSPLEDLVINGLASQHVLIDYDEPEVDSSITQALKVNLQQNSLYAIALCGSTGRFALLLPSSTNLTLLLLDHGPLLLDPWATEISNCRQESRDERNPSFWKHNSTNTILSNHPSTVLGSALKYLTNLPETLPVLTERLEYIWKSGVICLSDSKKNCIKFSLVHCQRMNKAKKDQILDLKLKLALKILSQIKTVSEFCFSSTHKSTIDRDSQSASFTNSGNADFSTPLRCSNTSINTNPLRQPSFDLSSAKNYHPFGVQSHENQDYPENDIPNSEKWFFCESIGSLISSSKSNSQNKVSKFSQAEYSPNHQNTTSFNEKKSSPRSTDSYSTAPSVSEPEEHISDQKNEFSNCLSVSDKHNDTIKAELQANDFSFLSKKLSEQRKSSPKNNIDSTGISGSFKNNDEESCNVQKPKKTLELFCAQNSQTLNSHVNAACTKTNDSISKPTPIYCLAPGLTSYLRMKHGVISRTPNIHSDSVTEPVNKKIDSTKHQSKVSSADQLPDVSNMKELDSSGAVRHSKKQCVNVKNIENLDLGNYKLCIMGYLNHIIKADISRASNTGSKEIKIKTPSNNSAITSRIQASKVEPISSFEFFKNLTANFYHLDYIRDLSDSPVSFSPKGESITPLEFAQVNSALVFDAKTTSALELKDHVIPSKTTPESSILQADIDLSQQSRHLKRSLETNNLQSKSFDFDFKNSSSYSHFSEDKGIVTCLSPEISSNHHESLEPSLSSADGSYISKKSMTDLSVGSRRTIYKNTGYDNYKPRECYVQKNGSIRTSKLQHKYSPDYSRDYERLDLKPKLAPSNRSSFKESSKRDLSPRHLNDYHTKRYSVSFDETKSFRSPNQHSAQPYKLYDYKKRPNPHTTNSSKKEQRSFSSRSNEVRNSYSKYDRSGSNHKNISEKDYNY